VAEEAEDSVTPPIEAVDSVVGPGPMIPSPPEALDDEDLVRNWLATNTCSS
jgi:hypothetical protein